MIYKVYVKDSFIKIESKFLNVLALNNAFVE